MLISLLSHPEMKIQLQSAVAIRNMSVTPDSKVKIVEEGAIGALISLLRSPDLRLQEQSAVIFRNLSVNSENKVTIVEADAVPPLLALLRPPQEPAALEGDPEFEAQLAAYRQQLKVQEQAAGALRNLSMHADNKPKMVSLGCIPPTLLLLSSEEPRIQEQGAGILRNMSVSAPHGKLMVLPPACPACPAALLPYSCARCCVSAAALLTGPPRHTGLGCYMRHLSGASSRVYNE